MPDKDTKDFSKKENRQESKKKARDVKGGTVIIRNTHRCRSPAESPGAAYQEKIHGTGARVANLGADGPVCTVCGFGKQQKGTK